MGKISFFAEIYALVAGIPPGKVMTYGQIALALGRPRAAKSVGTAMRLTPEHLGLPCHRVVNAQGGLAPGDAFGGPGMQLGMLRAEGVPFLANGRIDLTNCLWHPKG
ncbi:MAG: MGMT family protein [Clostridia bacterium]|nr:MGMT family protein [Clostridia bacterium]